MSHLSEDRFDELVARERARELPPLNSWAEISERAREEGIIHRGQRSLWSAGRPWMQAAAGIAILVGGITIGRSTSDGPGSPATGEAQVSATPFSASINTVEDAWKTLDRASAEYQSASAFLAARNTSRPAVADSTAIYRARLEALEQLMNATQMARENAPRDPVINQYYLATLGAREATAQQLGAVRQAKLTGF
jgi:hypothetical protein